MPLDIQQQPAVQCTRGQQPTPGAVQGGKVRRCKPGTPTGAGEGLRVCVGEVGGGGGSKRDKICLPAFGIFKAYMWIGLSWAPP